MLCFKQYSQVAWRHTAELEYELNGRKWHMGMEDGACAWSMAHAHGVWRMRIQYGAYTWSMAHGVWCMRMEYGASTWSMVRVASAWSTAHWHGVWHMRMEYGACA